MDPLDTLKQIDSPILDAASQDFNLSKFCAMWGQGNELFPYSNQFESLKFFTKLGRTLILSSNSHKDQ